MGSLVDSDDTRQTSLRYLWWSQPDQTPEVLHGGNQEAFFCRSGQSPQLEPTEVKLLLEMSKEHFDLPALPGGPPESIRLLQRPHWLACLFIAVPC